MENVIIRVWVPDRPGALGAVASRIGAVGGDLIGIEILERGTGRAIDELVIVLPAPGLVEPLVQQVSQVDEVDVEEVHPARAVVRDPRLDALETAAILVGHTKVEGLLDSLVVHAMDDFDAGWAVIVDLTGPVAVAAAGEAPPAAWLGAFVAGGRSSMAVSSGESGPDDVAWAEMPAADLAVVLGRAGRPLRARERHQLSALARIADRRWAEPTWRRAGLAHPSAV